jgi:hypothetical protein
VPHLVVILVVCVWNLAAAAPAVLVALLWLLVRVALGVVATLQLQVATLLTNLTVVLVGMPFFLLGRVLREVLFPSKVGVEFLAVDLFSYLLDVLKQDAVVLFALPGVPVRVLDLAVVSASQVVAVLQASEVCCA